MKKLISAYAIENTGTAHVDVSGFDVPKLPLGTVRVEKIDFVDTFKKQVTRDVSYWKFEDNVITVKTAIHEDIELVINLVQEVAIKVLQPRYEMKFGQRGLPKGFDFGVVVWGTKKKVKKPITNDENEEDEFAAFRNANFEADLRIKTQKAARRAKLKAEKSGEQMESKNSITRDRLQQLIKEEYNKLNEEIDSTGIRTVVNSASKLLDAIAAFEKDLPPKSVEATIIHTSELKKSLEDMVSNPASYLVKPVKMVSLRSVKEGKEIGNDPNKLEEVEPAAYKALPSSYKNDHALTFYYDENGRLCATHDLGGEFCWNGKKWSRAQ